MIAAIIIAGGRARRFDGADKALIMFNGKPLLEHVLEQISPQVDLIAINRLSAMKEYELPVVPDIDSDKPGPIGGLEAAIDWATKLDARPDYLLTIPVDTPFLPSDLVAKLLPAAEKYGAAVACDKSGLQPTISLHKLGHIPLATIQDFKHKAFRDFWRSIGAKEIPFDEENAFININSPDDITRHQK